jgi:hypothetical protein
MAQSESHKAGTHGSSDPPPIGKARDAWIDLACQRGVTDKEYRLGVELWLRAGTKPYEGKPRCWFEHGNWVFRIWPRLEPKEGEAQEKQAMALTRRMGCKRRKVEIAMHGLSDKGLLRRVNRAGGPPGARMRFNLQADTLLLVPDSALRETNAHASVRKYAQTDQSGTHDHAGSIQLSQPTSLDKPTPPPNTNAKAKLRATNNANGLVSFAEETLEPTNPAGFEETIETPLDAFGWGQDGPDEHDLTEDMIQETLVAYPNLLPSSNNPKILIAAWRKLKGIPPRSLHRNIEQLMGIGVGERQARNAAMQFTSKPDQLRRLISQVQCEFSEGKIKDPAAVVCYRINKLNLSGPNER